MLPRAGSAVPKNYYRPHKYNPHYLTLRVPVSLTLATADQREQ